jgi:hypothetical protein
MKAGVAISPDTPSTAITDEIGAAADMLLVMTVYPGKHDLCCKNCNQFMTNCCSGRGGQKFLERCVPKVAELRSRFPEKDIEVDGGVGLKTIDACANAGTFPLIVSLTAELEATPREQRHRSWNRHFRRSQPRGRHCATEGHHCYCPGQVGRCVVRLQLIQYVYVVLVEKSIVFFYHRHLFLENS